MAGDRPLSLLLEVFIDHHDALREETLIYTLDERKLIYFAFFFHCVHVIGRS